MKMPILALLLLLLAALGAQAATTVNCSVTASSIAFGVYNPLSTGANTSTGSLRITCTGSGTGSKSETAGLTVSTGLSGSYATRKMFSGVNALSYNIYWSTAYNQVMGDGSGGSFAGSAGPFTVPAGGSNFATGTMYGMIPAGQDVAAGSYSDTLVVTVDF